MAASEELTWDIAPADGGARRPSLDDVGGALIEDHATHPPPKTGVMLYADLCNEGQRQLQAIAKVAPSAIVSVTFSGGTPSVASAKGPGGAVDTGFFTATDNGTGDTSITWTASTLPPQDCEPEASINGSTPAMHAIRSITNGVRMVTKDHANNAIDVPFTFRVN